MVLNQRDFKSFVIKCSKCSVFLASTYIYQYFQITYHIFFKYVLLSRMETLKPLLLYTSIFGIIRKYKQ